MLLARFYASRQESSTRGLGDRPNAARLLTALGRIDHLLGEDEEAVASLVRAHDLALEAGRDREAAGARRRPARAWGAPFLGQDRLEEAEEAFALAERALAADESGGDPAAAWDAQGDLARARGRADGAAERYRAGRARASRRAVPSAVGGPGAAGRVW